MAKPNQAMIAETLESLHPGLIEFLRPKLSLPDPDWTDVVEPVLKAQNPAFLSTVQRKIEKGGGASLEILDLASLLKIITFQWKRFYEDLGNEARNHFFGVLDIRNKVAHTELEDFSDQDALRHRDPIQRVAEICGHPQTQELATKYYRVILMQMSKTLTAGSRIPDAPLDPGDIFTVGYDAEEGRYSLFRIQVQTNPGGHRFNLVGTVGKGIRDSARMAYEYLKGNASKMGINRDIAAHDTHIQVISLMQAKDAGDLGVALFVAMVSALMGRPGAPGLVVLGNMSLHGVLSPVEGLGDKLRIALDSGARRMILPSTNKRDFADLPAELIEKLQIDFYGDPTKAAYKAIATGD